MLTTVALALFLLAPPQATPALHVVVIQGEDAVNIIQQKTAVKPVVEVRDRNNLPVSGALVTFTIEGGKAATFGGASTMTVATNAAGQAAVSSLSPAVSGAVQINVSAAFQGQIATATITQTNVMTAAQAAAAGAASSGSASGAGGGGAGGATGGAAGGAGGGLSTTTLVVAGAAVAGGAVAAKEISNQVGGHEEEYSGPFTGTFTSTVTGPGGTCQFSSAVSATGRLRVPQPSDSSLQGSVHFKGTETLNASGCQPPPPPTFENDFDVTGTPSNFSGSSNINLSSTGSNGFPIVGKDVWSFQGSISGSNVTGTLKIERRSTGGSTGGDIVLISIGTFSMSLNKP